MTIPRTKTINGKRYYFLGTYYKPPSSNAVQRTGASVYERRHYKSFKQGTSKTATGKSIYYVYYRDVVDKKKKREHKKVGRYSYNNKRNKDYTKLFGQRIRTDL